MIVSTEDLPSYRGAVTMADGGFDPLHHGHIAYLGAAAALGLPVLCNVSPDQWVSRKHPALLDQSERVTVVDAIRFVDLTHLSTTETVDVLRLLQPRYYAKGADWRGRLPDAEQAACAELDIEVVYLDTVLDSSTAILERYERRQRTG